MENFSFLSEFTVKSVAGGSLIRKMFNLGNELKAKYGKDNVFDFSLGNPSLEPPQEFKDALKEVASSQENGLHAYMANAGVYECRKNCAKLCTKLQRIPEAELKPEGVVITVGAAGGLNVVLKSILERDDEVLICKPYFTEYPMYISNHGGITVQVENDEDFNIDFEDLKSKVNKKTRGIIINSPNNPSGKVYSQEDINRIGNFLENKSKEFGRAIWMISDEPYSRIVYDNVVVHSTFESYVYSMVVGSFSKDLSIPGDRLGYVALNPKCPNQDMIMAALSLWNRALGFVNAPATIQRAIARIPLNSVDINYYKERRDALMKGLTEAGITFPKPDGAFYIFAKCPKNLTSMEFVDKLAEKNVLVVPGKAFGGDKYIRMSYACEMDTILRAIPKIKEVVNSL